MSSHLAGVLAATAEATAEDVGGGAGGVEAAAVEATLGRQRRLSEDCREECTNPSSATVLAATMGKTIYSPNYLSHCYRVKVGDMIDSIAGQDGDVDCSTSSGWSGGVSYYVNGHYNADASPADGSSQKYTDGDSSGCLGSGRSSTLTLTVLPASTGDLQIDVVEDPQCAYNITLSGSVEDFGLPSCIV